MARLGTALIPVVLIAGCSAKVNSPDRHYPNVTLRKYEKIQSGMTLGDVEQIMGATGDRYGFTATSDRYLWFNADGTGVLVVMDSKYGKLYRKSRIGTLK